MVIDKILLTILLFLTTITATYANSSKYFCSGDINNLYVIFDTNTKKVILENTFISEAEHFIF